MADEMSDFFSSLTWSAVMMGGLPSGHFSYLWHEYGEGIFG